MFKSYLVAIGHPEMDDHMSTMQCYVDAKHLEVRGVLNEAVVQPNNARFIVAANEYVRNEEEKEANTRQDTALAGSGYSSARAWRCAADTPTRALCTLVSILIAFSNE